LAPGKRSLIGSISINLSRHSPAVAGAGFVALATTLPTLGIIPADGVRDLLGVERFVSGIRVVTNLVIKIFTAIVVLEMVSELRYKRLRGALNADIAEISPARRNKLGLHNTD
jgi:aerobic C4-dicarboxylate transport protein